MPPPQATTTPYRQELPPKGGFPSVSTRRFTPPWGPTPKQWWLIGIGVSAIGLVATVINNRNLRAIKREEKKAKFIVTPLLQAQEDEMYLQNRADRLRVEAEIMADERDWEVGASNYHQPDLTYPD